MRASEWKINLMNLPTIGTMASIYTSRRLHLPLAWPQRCDMSKCEWYILRIHRLMSKTAVMLSLSEGWRYRTLSGSATDGAAENLNHNIHSQSEVDDRSKASCVAYSPTALLVALTSAITSLRCGFAFWIMSQCKLVHEPPAVTWSEPRCVSALVGRLLFYTGRSSIGYFLMSSSVHAGE